ncbi:MAG: hypothetical protein EPO00_01340 [Chloroflexota bacterium]|nr:MAG: hypothetical protein EPO00_01340 [Chloroflexota bacterium]
MGARGKGGAGRGVMRGGGGAGAGRGRGAGARREGGSRPVARGRGRLEARRHAYVAGRARPSSLSCRVHGHAEHSDAQQGITDPTTESDLHRFTANPR